MNQFADATGDHQWIHVDPVRAAAGPFGGPIAHGYLTLSLSNALLPEIVEVQGISMGVNYGVGKVRFPAPVLGRLAHPGLGHARPRSRRWPAACRPPWSSPSRSRAAPSRPASSSPSAATSPDPPADLSYDRALRKFVRGFFLVAAKQVRWLVSDWPPAEREPRDVDSSC